jgi:hypothetical protein
MYSIYYTNYFLYVLYVLPTVTAERTFEDASLLFEKRPKSSLLFEKRHYYSKKGVLRVHFFE